MLTNHPTEISSALAPIGRVAVAIALSAVVLSALAPTPAHAGGIETTNCVGPWWRSFSCVNVWGAPVDPYVRVVPSEALSEDDRAQLAARDRRWTVHCRPVLERDSYGVARYRYWAHGCEFGVGAD